MPDSIDVAIIGGGQAAMSVAYFLRRTSRSFLVLDAEDGPGGAWRHGWQSLRLFSPAHASSVLNRCLNDHDVVLPAQPGGPGRWLLAVTAAGFVAYGLTRSSTRAIEHVRRVR